ncbi:MAG: helicase C-terminal domain-containing protein [bacterium]
MTEVFIRQCLEPRGKLEKLIPWYEYRSQQLEMSIDIYNALHNKTEVFLAEAGTGTGKSLAYLLPVAAIQKRAIISTGTKNLQEQLIKKDIPLLNQLLDKTLYAVLMKGRNNYLCQRRFEDFRSNPEFYSVKEKTDWQKIQDWADCTETGDREEMDFLSDTSETWQEICSRREECLGQRCPFNRSCFLARLKIQAQAADLIVVNHHLYFADTALRKDNSFSALPQADIVVFDEAHLLEDIATHFLGSHLSHADIRSFVKMIRRWKSERDDLKSVIKRLENPLRGLEEGAKLFFDSMPSGTGRFALENIMLKETERLGSVLLERLDDFQVSLAREVLVLEEFIDDWKETCRTFSDSMRLFIERSEPGIAWWGEHTGQGNALHATPVDISRDFKRTFLKSGQSVVLLSATMTTENSFKYIIDRLGLADSQTQIYPSPFDYTEQGILYLPQALPDPNHPDFYAECAQEIIRLLEITQGKAFILSTSYAGMEKLHSLIVDSIKHTLLVQGDMPKHRLIKKFQQDVHSVLLATISFWQGVDVPGESLSAVIIDKLPFASPSDPVVKARIKFFREKELDPFNGFQVPLAVMMLKQGIGRLIRSRSDRGLVAVLDQRISTRRYGQKFIQSLPEFKISHSLDDVRLFFYR